MSYRGWILVITLSIFIISANGVLADSGTTSDSALVDATPLSTDAVPVDEVVIEVSVQADGTADWQIQYRTRLVDPDLRDAFASLNRDIDENPDYYLEPFGNWIADTAAAAADYTGRNMAIESLHVEAETRFLPQEYGIVTYQFTWVGFAQVDETTISVGDAITGFFLDEYSRLRIHWPLEYQYQEAIPEPDEIDETSLTWIGPVDFTGDQPRITIGTPGVGDTISSMWYAVVLAAAIVIGIMVLFLRPEDRFGRQPDEPPSTTASGGMKPSLMSNEERVITLLEECGGRLKQQEIARHLGWTEAKTSSVIKQMREEGIVVAFRLGRENVVSLDEQQGTS